jgi:parallel beta-helix repeat protein
VIEPADPPDPLEPPAPLVPPEPLAPPLLMDPAQPVLPEPHPGVPPAALFSSSLLQPATAAHTESAPASIVETNFIAFILDLKPDSPRLPASERWQSGNPARFRYALRSRKGAVWMHTAWWSFRKASSFTSLVALAMILIGCGEDEASAVGGASGTGGSGGTGGAGAPATCDITLSPGENDTEVLQTALIEADPDSTICLQPGTYEVEKELLLTGTAGITVRGIGASRDDVVLDFAKQDAGDEAVDVQADRFTLESVTLKDPPGDGVKVSNSDRPTFRDIKAYWSAGSDTANGAYALYPALSNNVLIEHCEVVGASDAGIYLGQSTTGIVRHNKAHGNVVGIEAENSTEVAIYDNEAWNNACGILVVNLPNLTKKVMRGASVFDNLVYDNNHENFAEEGAFVGSVPQGTGI